MNETDIPEWPGTLFLPFIPEWPGTLFLPFSLEQYHNYKLAHTAWYYTRMGDEISRVCIRITQQEIFMNQEHLETLIENKLESAQWALKDLMEHKYE